MKLLDKYFEIQKQIYDYFGYVEGWTVMPLDDTRSYYWHTDSDEVYFCNSRENLQAWVNADMNDQAEGIDGHDCYSNEIIGDRSYEGAEYTMLVVDTNTDGNRFLQVFDNAKRL